MVPPFSGVSIHRVDYVVLWVHRLAVYGFLAWCPLVLYEVGVIVPRQRESTRSFCWKIQGGRKQLQ